MANHRATVTEPPAPVRVPLTAEQLAEARFILATAGAARRHITARRATDPYVHPRWQTLDERLADLLATTAQGIEMGQVTGLAARRTFAYAVVLWENYGWTEHKHVGTECYRCGGCTRFECSYVALCGCR